MDVWPLYMQSLGSANEITQIPVGSRSHEKTQKMTVTHSAILNDACIQTIYFLGMFMEFSQFGMITGWMTSLPYPVRLKKIVPQRTRKGSSHLESSHEFKAVQAVGISFFKGLGVSELNMYNRFCILGEKFTIRQLQTLRPTLDLDTNSSSM